MNDPDRLYRRHLPDGRLIDVNPLTFGRARICIGPGDRPVYDDAW